MKKLVPLCLLGLTACTHDHPPQQPRTVYQQPVYQQPVNYDRREQYERHERRESRGYAPVPAYPVAQPAPRPAAGGGFVITPGYGAAQPASRPAPNGGIFTVIPRSPAVQPTPRPAYPVAVPVQPAYHPTYPVAQPVAPAPVRESHHHEYSQRPAYGTPVAPPTMARPVPPLQANPGVFRPAPAPQARPQAHGHHGERH
jgi:hypothetical protein